MTQQVEVSGTFGQLLLMAKEQTAKQAQKHQKIAVVDAQTLAGGGGDPAAMGGDPMAAGGGGDPMAAAMGGDPAAMGGDPAAMGGGGGGGPDMAAMMARLQALEQQLAAGGGGGGAAGAGGVEPIKPKIDVNVTLLQVLKILAKIADALGVQMSAAEMVATQEDLTSFAMNQSGGAGAAGGAGGGGGSAIKPVSPMGGASPAMAKASQHAMGARYEQASQGLTQLSDRAAALSAVMAARN